MKKVPLKRKTVLGRHSPRSPKKGSRSDETISTVLRGYGLPESVVKRGRKGLRYSSPLERGVLWYWFSLFIRQRDKNLPCISCGKQKEDMQGGHFIPAGSMSWDGMVFNEKNVSAECSNCNLRDKRKLGYGIELDKRFGTGTKDKLERDYEQYKTSRGDYKNWNKDTLKQKIEHYRSLVATP